MTSRVLAVFRRIWRVSQAHSMMPIITSEETRMDDQAALKPGFGVVPLSVLASRPGLDFVRGIFDQTLPQPPIMQTIEPFDCTAEAGQVVGRGGPGRRRGGPGGAGRGGGAAALRD